MVAKLGVESNIRLGIINGDGAMHAVQHMIVKVNEYLTAEHESDLCVT